MSRSHTEHIRTILAAAIANRRQLAFRYKDVDRCVEPHILGVDRQSHLALSARQVSGTGLGWRLFHVDRMERLTLTERRFDCAARGYNPGDPAFATVLRRL